MLRVYALATDLTMTRLQRMEWVPVSLSRRRSGWNGDMLFFVCGKSMNGSLKIWQVEAAASALEASCPAQPSKTKLSGVWDARLEITVGNWSCRWSPCNFLFSSHFNWAAKLRAFDSFMWPFADVGPSPDIRRLSEDLQYCNLDHQLLPITHVLNSFLWKLRVIGEFWGVYESCEIPWVSGVGESNVASLWGTAEGSSNGKIGPFVGDVTQLYSRNSTSNGIQCFFGGSKGSKGNRCKRFRGKHLWMMCASSMLLSLVLFEWRCRPLPKTEGLNMIGFGRTESRSFHTYEPVAKGRERDHGRPANQALFGWSFCLVSEKLPTLITDPFPGPTWCVHCCFLPKGEIQRDSVLHFRAWALQKAHSRPRFGVCVRICSELRHAAQTISRIYLYDKCTPRTQMTLVLNGKGLLFESSNPKIEDKQVPGIFICWFIVYCTRFSNSRHFFVPGSGVWTQRFVDAGLRVMNTPSLFVLRKRRT